MLQNRLNVLVAQKGLSIQKIHDDTGLSRTTISNLVNNAASGIQTSTLNTLCLYLGVTPSQVFDYVPFDLVYQFEKDEFSKGMDDINPRYVFSGIDDDVQYIRAVIHANNRQFTNVETDFTVRVSFNSKLSTDFTGYQREYAAYVYMDGWDGEYNDSQQRFRDEYFSKLSLAFKESFFEELKKGITQYMSKALSSHFQNQERNASVIINMPFQRTVEGTVNID